MYALRARWPATVPRCAMWSPAPPASSARTSPRRSQPPGTSGRRRRVHRLLRPGAKAGERRRARRRRGRSRRRRLDALARRCRRRLPPRRPAGRAGELRRRLRPVRPAQRLASARVFEAAARRRRPRRVRVVVVGLRRRRGLSDARGRASAADLAVRRDEARCEHLAYAHARTGGLDVVGAPLLHGLRAAPAARHGVHRLLEALAAGGRSRSSATAPHRAASRTSTTRSPPRSPRWSAAGRGRSTTSAAARRRR